MLRTVLIFIHKLFLSTEQPQEIGIHIEPIFTDEEIQEQRLHKI